MTLEEPSGAAIVLAVSVARGLDPMTSPPGNYPPLDPVATQETSNWAAGERRSTPRWLAWPVAVASAAILLLPVLLAMSRGEDAYDVGRAMGRTGFALTLALIVRGVYVRARGRPWRSAISAWLLPVAVVCLFVSGGIRSLPEIAERQQRIQAIETLAPADYLNIQEPYELTRLSPEEETRIEAEMTETMQEAKGTALETRYVELDGEPVGVVMVMAVEPAVVADPDYLDDVQRGAEEAGADASSGDLQGQRVIWGRLPDESVFVIWQHEALVITAFALDRLSAEEIATQLMAAN